jgi:AcrR family transcriptional regulator
MCAAPSQHADAGPVRERVLEAAEECIQRFGVGKTTMEDIARAASISRATLYRYFADREDVVVAAVERRIRISIPRAQAHIGRWPTFAERLVEGTLFNVERARRDPFIRLLVSANQSGLGSRTLGREAISVDLAHALWEPFFTEAQANGDMRPDLDQRAAARWLASVNLMLANREDAGGTDREADRRELETFLLPAFLPAG